MLQNKTPRSQVKVTGSPVTPPCVAESDQRHAQHALKMLGIDFSSGSYQTNSERIMLLNSWYQIDMSLYSNRYLFVRSVGRNDSHIFCARPCHFSLPGWRHGSPGNHAHLHRRRHVQICKYYTHCYPSIFATASLTTCAVAMKNVLFRPIKISEFGKWVERHNGDHVNHVTSDDVTGDQKVAQPSRVHATKSVALATRWCPPGWVKA